jgi:2-polyprenyl-3-methyl-5-hydroxy-6-metoxy-1,4-benzoquinol methylase
MPLIIDPEQNEVRALRRIGSWRGQRVIEIGCGEGRLSLRLARLGAHVYAIDTNRERLAAARRNLPPQFAARIRYEFGRAGSVRRRDATFDRAIFAWAL